MLTFDKTQTMRERERDVGCVLLFYSFRSFSLNPNFNIELLNLGMYTVLFLLENVVLYGKDVLVYKTVILSDLLCTAFIPRRQSTIYFK